MRDILFEGMVQAGDNTAVLDQGQSYSYQQLLNDVSALQHRLKPHQGTHILMSAQRSYSSVALYAFSVLYGYTLVPVNSEIDSKSMTRLLTELPVAFFFTDSPDGRLSGIAEQVDCPILSLHVGCPLSSAHGSILQIDPPLPHQETSVVPQERATNRALYLIFTSGSTGNPKGVTVEEAHLLNYLEATHREFDLQPTDVISHISPLSFDFSVHEIFLAFYNRAAIAVLRENNKFNFAQYLNRCQVSVWSSVPSTVAYLAKTRQLKEGQYPSLRVAFVGGEPVSTDLLSQFAAAAPNCHIYSYYGPTECTVAMMTCPYHPGQDYGKYMPLGEPFGGHQMLIQPEDKEHFQEYGTGEAYIAGPQVLGEYWRNPEQSAKRFLLDPNYGPMFRTGDIVCKEEGGHCRFIARDDDDIKIGGYRFNTAACRDYVKEVSGAEEVLVTPVRSQQDTGFDKLLVVTVNAQMSEASLARVFRDNYDNYLQPHFIDVSEIPQNANGKVDKKALFRRIEHHG